MTLETEIAYLDLELNLDLLEELDKDDDYWFDPDEG